ncbi:glycosyltransferase [Nocardioides hwasunensis]|uniref:Streptomycin biosynthesis protein StrF domain-containing protein n=1 Tax=Nocardioides hwasunensis TaxID=397258 RepID=A0ABR8MQA5_9ACTN|nr:glycosyltransferase [Nocardioides hwasunensis]MBD3917010.1 hypothetical protein [Nocardioides hwasunensis]
MAPEDVLLREQGSDGICAAYNRILARARQMDDCEGVVLIHDDVALGPAARGQLLDGLRGRGIGVVGAVGGRGLYGPQWVDARTRAGYADDFYGWRRFGPAEADVDVVDGLLLALSPSAFHSIDFDADALPAFHGYDTDYCLLVRRAGYRVRVVHVDYVHRDKGSVGDSDAFDSGAATLRSRWPEEIRPLGKIERVWRDGRDRGAAWYGRTRHHAMTGVKSLRDRALR